MMLYYEFIPFFRNRGLPQCCDLHLVQCVTSPTPVVISKMLVCLSLLALYFTVPGILGFWPTFVFELFMYIAIQCKFVFWQGRLQRDNLIVNLTFELVSCEINKMQRNLIYHIILNIDIQFLILLSQLIILKGFTKWAINMLAKCITHEIK